MKKQTMSLDFLNKELKVIIERKHRELQLGKGYEQIFSKIKDFEGNAIGQIGRNMLKVFADKFVQ